MNECIYTLYFREDCHLCENMIEELIPLFQAFPAAVLELKDVDRHAEAKALYDRRIPVLAFGQEVLSEYFLDYDRVRQHLMGNKCDSKV